MLLKAPKIVGDSCVKSIGFGPIYVAPLVLAVIALLSGCSNGSSGGGPSVPYVIPPGLNFNNCELSPLTGPIALMDNGKKTSFVESSFFGKPYDEYDLAAVLDANFASTVEYVRSVGVNLMKSKSNSSQTQSCPMYFNLEEAKPYFMQKWDEASKNTNSSAILGGIFFEFCANKLDADIPELGLCDERKMVSPTIILNNGQSDRWTLVHEMMHYNFNQGRKAAPDIPSNTMIEKMAKFHSEQFRKFMRDFATLPNRGDLSSAVKELEQLVRISHHLMFRKALEEIAIEGMLIDLWAKGEFKNFGARTPNTWYMEFSREQAMKQAGAFDGIVSPLMSEAELNFWPEIVTEIKAVKELIDIPKHETLRMIKEAKAKIATKTGRAPEDFPETDGTTEPVEIPSVSARSLGVTAEADFDHQHAHNHLEQLDREQREKRFIEMLRDLKRELKN